MNVDVPADDDGHGDDDEHENNKPTTEHQKWEIRLCNKSSNRSIYLIQNK